MSSTGLADTDLSVLITGESGVGKDVFSRIIHENSSRKHVRQGKALISVNCGAIPEGTIESELFGHEKGTFPVSGYGHGRGDVWRQFEFYF